MALATLELATAACNGPGASPPSGASERVAVGAASQRAPRRPPTDRVPAVVACVDDQPWPPFTYREGQGPLQGASVALLREALGRAGRSLVITEVPWMRCLFLLRRGEADLTLDTSHTEGRARTYRFGPELYRIRSALYYVKARFPGGLPVRLDNGLETLTYCGMRGYNYDAYPIPRRQIDTGARGPIEAFAKLRVGRCQAVIGYPTSYRELARLGVLDLRGIGTHPLLGHRALAYYLMLSRKGSAPDELLGILRAQLEAMRRDGTHARILGSFGMNGPRKGKGSGP